MSRNQFLSLLILLLLPYLGVGQSDPQLVLWYGARQYFGQQGQAQRWINVLGNVSPADQLVALTYELNGKPGDSLRWGSDLHRLAQAGDVNVELSWEQVQSGENELRIHAYFQNGETQTAYTILVVEKARKWPLPYEVDFSQLTDLQQVVQVVDGKWILTDSGVRTAERYYDRVLSLGDTSWRDYEALIQLTLHDFTPSEPGPPTYNVTHFGVAFRWRGHHVQPGMQPSRKWFPLGSQGEFLLKNPPDSSHWRILYDGGKTAPSPTYSSERNAYYLDQPMWIRAQVRTLPQGDTQYRFKQWRDDQPEPISWDVSGEEEGKRDYPSGALCLVPHNSDVTIHQVQVQPLPTNPISPAKE